MEFNIDFDIDFDEASKEWMKNKKKKGNGFFLYKCAHWSENKQSFCKNKLTGNNIYCKYHCKN
jgi:hypothetical protein